MNNEHRITNIQYRSNKIKRISEICEIRGLKTVFIRVNSWFRGYDPYLKKQSQFVRYAYCVMRPLGTSLAGRIARGI